MRISDPRRLRAVCVAALAESKEQGHCFDEALSLQEHTKQYPLFYKSEYEVNVNFRELLSSYLSHFQEKLVIRKEAGCAYFYLKSAFDDEQLVANTIQKLIDSEKLEETLTDLVEDLEKAAAELRGKVGTTFDSEQFIEERKALYEKLPKKRFFVLSGMPGSGKSYELLKLVDRLSRKGEKSLILTLTGKAALCLKNNPEGFKSIDARTIDKFLAESARFGDGKRIVPNLIIDEMSMVDLDKLAEILNRVNTQSPYFKRLILVGDENQLPPIGAGKVFEDILEYLRTGESRLTDYRAASK